LNLRFDNWQDLAEVLVEFAEDIHNDIGIWKSLENYHLKFFGEKLPLTPKTNDNNSNPINSDRFHHFLWVLLPEYKADLILSPAHKDLMKLATSVAKFLKERFANVPKDSGVKKYLEQPVRYGWDVKRKLVWLGKHSYLFRDQCSNYIHENDEADRLTVLDDFVNQQNTSWSGLGVIDILASILNISEKQRKELKSWYERHLSFYKILSGTGAIVKALNTINNENYSIRVGEDLLHLFEPGTIFLGSLVPWNGEWYWSGSQTTLPAQAQEQLQEIKRNFIIKSAAVVYRYDASLLKQAEKSIKKHYENFVKFKGQDFVIYPNGHSLVADFKKWHQFLFDSSPEHIKKEFKEKHKVSEYSINIPFPREIIEFDNGIGFYYNPEEGQEIMLNFNDLIEGMKKKGTNLTEDEEYTIRGFIQSDAISPLFVIKIVNQYGEESIAAAFLIKDFQNDYYMDYLLRRYKGHYYRNRYPAISIMD
jgi:hypothetical protein